VETKAVRLAPTRIFASAAQWKLASEVELATVPLNTLSLPSASEGSPVPAVIAAGCG